MHSSMMHTACSSSHLLEGVCLSACWDTTSHSLGLDPPARPPTYPPDVGLETPPPLERILDTPF